MGLIDDIQTYTNREPRVHPNGFMQFDLDQPTDTNDGHSGGTKRLHIWHPDLPRQKTRSSIHDHVFNMESVILHGKLRQVLFSPRLERYPGGYTHEVLLPDYESTSSQLRKTGVFVRLLSQDDLTYWPRQSYTQTAFTFHDTRVADDEVTATIMTKKKIYPNSTPRVLLPVTAGEPDNDFDRHTAMPTDRLWEIMDATFHEMSGWAIHQIREQL
jgi:hypothetical protein